MPSFNLRQFRSPHIASGELAARALPILEECKGTSLVVINEDERVAGVLHLHDLWGIELI